LASYEKDDAHFSVCRYNLIKILQRFGELKSFELLFHKSGVKKGEPRGYCFVEYKTHDVSEILHIKKVVSKCKIENVR